MRGGESEQRRACSPYMITGELNISIRTIFMRREIIFICLLISIPDPLAAGTRLRSED